MHMQNDDAAIPVMILSFIFVGVMMIVLLFAVVPSAVSRSVVVSGPGAGTDITAEYTNASTDHGRECTKDDRYSRWTRYICIENISQEVTEAEIGRGATSIAEEYFMYDFIYDNQTFDLEPNKLYYIEYDLQVGYCRGKGEITSAKVVMDYCDECTRDPDGRIQGCCKDVGCIES